MGLAGEGTRCSFPVTGLIGSRRADPDWPPILGLSNSVVVALTYLVRWSFAAAVLKRQGMTSVRPDIEVTDLNAEAITGFLQHLRRCGATA